MPPNITRTERLATTAQRIGITTRYLLQLIDHGHVPAIKTAAGHLEVPATYQPPAEWPEPDENADGHHA